LHVKRIILAMKISYNWLRGYIPTDLDPAVIADILTNIGLEVEGIETFESVKGGLEGVVVGEVLSCTPHPGADRLTITQVDPGTGLPLQIICGAPNVAPGQKVPVAMVGATLYPGGQALTIKKTRIRGEESNGMICAEDELGLGDSHEGIMVLDPDVAAGTPASRYFGITTDTVFEIGITPNRIDAASHLGVARDLAAYLSQKVDVKLKRPSVEGFTVDNTSLVIPVEIVEKAGCRRYSGLTLSGVTVRESPGWLRERLRSIGLSPINNVVDCTNFVLHECGQPLHAFDASQVTGKRILVRTMPEGTRFVTLDGQERTLLSSDLVISNAQEAMCIAGVFGGIRSGVTENTRDIFLESACFDPVFIRKTSRHHQLLTDASFRFERGSDPDLTVWALKRAAVMIREIAGGSISSEVVDVYPEPVKPARVEITYENVNRLIGNRIQPDVICSILESLDIRVEHQDKKGLVLSVPPYRVDVLREADIIEEILRIYGFNRVEVDQTLRSTISHAPKPDREKMINLVSETLTANGFYELKSNSLTRTAYYDTAEGEDPGAVRLHNPLSQDLAVMRKTLLYGGLEAVSYNSNRKNPDLNLYEFGFCYYRDHSPDTGEPLAKFSEQLHLGIFLSGNSHAGNWMKPAEPSSFYLLKSYVELVLKRLGIDPDSLEEAGNVNGNLSEGVNLASGKIPLVEFGQVSPALLEKFDIGQEVFAAEFKWENVMRLAGTHSIRFRPLPRFQVVTRDLSLLLDRGVTYGSLRSLAFRTEPELLKKVTLFDVYEGEKIEQGKKSYALSFTLLDEEKTLTDKQIERTMNHIARAFEQQFGAIVRGKE
jgi:phenylalanyl-tRNA synthetase beta chain